MSMGGERHATEGERRRMPRYYLAVPVDIWMDDRREREPYWGSLIEQLRPSKVGLRQIAKDLGFMLGDVVREVNKGEKVVRTADRARRSARRGR